MVKVNYICTANTKKYVISGTLLLLLGREEGIICSMMLTCLGIENKLLFAFRFTNSLLDQGTNLRLRNLGEPTKYFKNYIRDLEYFPLT